MAFPALEKLNHLVFPDAWQAQAIQALRQGKDVVVSAPTGAGKTYVFERWVEQGGFSKRALFTVPTRALANDKYAEWKAKGWKVGIVTGDLTLQPEAPVVVATLEAVQGLVSGSLVLPESERTEGGGPRPVADGSFQLLVVDEYHWLADEARGNHYEGVLLCASPQLQLLLLSGAVANPEEVVAWLQRLGRSVVGVSTKVRPVPIEEVEADDLIGGLPSSIQGFWSRRVAGALRAGLGPVLVFAPHRQDAERLARQFARELPMSEALTLTKEQERLCSSGLARLLRARVAYHHSGLGYAQRAGLIEPLAKAGQLRVVVATLGLSAGINFSLRSVVITTGGYRHEHLDRDLEPHEILQMIGRAGRRGLDETGYVLLSSSSPRLRSAAPLRLRRAAPLPWAFLLRLLRGGAGARRLTFWAQGRFFTDKPLALGLEASTAQEDYPCGQATDTGRARLVRRCKRPFPACAACPHRDKCLQLSTTPTLLWQWQRLGLLDRQLRLSSRGELASFFLGPEGLALGAALLEQRYPLGDLVYDCANLFAGDRFSGTNPRRLGRLVQVCERAFQGLSAEGFLDRGLPPQYGWGASELVRALVEQGEKARRLLDEHQLAGRGDLDRLMTEWRSLVRQVCAAPETLRCPEAGPQDRRLGERWTEFRSLCLTLTQDWRPITLPELPGLTPEQKRPFNHRLLMGPGARTRVR